MVKRNLLGIELYDTNRTEIVEFLDNSIQKKEKNIVFGISAAAYGRFKFRPGLYGIFKRIDILLAEGAGIPLFARCFGVKITEKIGQVNLMYDLLDLANVKKYSVMLFGATEETNTQANRLIREKYPDIKVCEGISGYFSPHDVENLIEKINKNKPDILFIGISYPLKERFSLKYKDILDCKVILPVGGAFEVLVGNVKRPKKDTKKLPVAWLYRLFQEPKRMFKPIFVTVLYSVFIFFPVMLFLHYTRIERNPSVGRYFRLTGNEWIPEKNGLFDKSK